MSKLIKINNPSLSEFEGQKPDYEKRLDFFDREANKNKFWRIRVYGKHIVRHWGRHGSKGQMTVHYSTTYLSAWAAREEAYLLYRQKIKKGYIKDETTILDHIVRKIN